MLEKLREIQKELDERGDMISAAQLQSVIDRVAEAEADALLNNPPKLATTPQLDRHE